MLIWRRGSYRGGRERGHARRQVVRDHRPDLLLARPLGLEHDPHPPFANLRENAATTKNLTDHKLFLPRSC